MPASDRSGLLREVWARLDRAADHLEQLDREVEAFLRREPYRIRNDVYSQAREWVVRLAISEEPPLRLSLLIGDVVHNLRSCLDHLVCVFATRMGHSCDKTQFPIYTDRDKYLAESPRMTVGVSAAALDVIERSQPYRAVDAGHDINASLLYQLYELWNRDKHRAILLAASCLPEMQITFPEGAELVSVAVGRVLDDGAEIAVLRWSETVTNMYVKYDLPPTVGFGEMSGPATGSPAVPMLRGAFANVRDIVIEGGKVL